MDNQPVMTVAELVAELQKLDQAAHVVIDIHQDDQGDYALDCVTVGTSTGIVFLNGYTEFAF